MALLSAIIQKLAEVDLGNAADFCHRGVMFAVERLMFTYSLSDLVGGPTQRRQSYDSNIVYAYAFVADGINYVADRMFRAGSASTTTQDLPYDVMNMHLVILFRLAESLRIAHSPRAIFFAIEVVECRLEALPTETHRRRTLDSETLALKQEHGVPVISTILWLLVVLFSHITDHRAAQEGVASNSTKGRYSTMVDAFEHITAFIKVSCG